MWKRRETPFRFPIPLYSRSIWIWGIKCVVRFLGTWMWCKRRIFLVQKTAYLLCGFQTKESQPEGDKTLQIFLFLEKPAKSKNHPITLTIKWILWLWGRRSLIDRHLYVDRVVDHFTAGTQISPNHSWPCLHAIVNHTRHLFFTYTENWQQTRAFMYDGAFQMTSLRDCHTISGGFVPKSTITNLSSAVHQSEERASIDFRRDRLLIIVFLNEKLCQQHFFLSSADLSKPLELINNQ